MCKLVSLNGAALVFGCTHRLLLLFVPERTQHECMWRADSDWSVTSMSTLNWYKMTKQNKTKPATHGEDLNLENGKEKDALCKTCKLSGHSVTSVTDTWFAQSFQML